MFRFCSSVRPSAEEESTMGPSCSIMRGFSVVFDFESFSATESKREGSNGADVVTVASLCTVREKAFGL